MRAVQVTSLAGPAAVEVVDVPEPTPWPGQVVIEVAAVGVSFPDVLLSKGEYQLKPELPFTLGVDFAGTIVEGAGDLQAGQRVVACLPYGGAAERVAHSPEFVFALPDSLSFEKAAAIPMNYMTAHFVLVERGDLKAGETVLVHGAAGGVGTATIQVARGLGARVIAVVSTSAKAEVAKAAGADEVVLLDGFRDAVTALGGADIVVDVVGGDAFTDSMRCLRPQGRLMVVGFAAGQGIPEVKVNRLLLNNIDVRGAAWGAHAMVTPGYMQSQWAALLPLIEDGTIDPPIGQTYAFEEFGQALADIDERRAVGKSVVRLT